MIEINYTLTLGAALIGLASSIHCVGMCGGIVGALSYSLPAEIRDNRAKRFAYVTSYNLGRLTSYAVMGMLAGLLGGEIFNLSGSGHFVMRLVAALLIIMTGFYLAGWFPQFARSERLGEMLWRKLAPIGQRLIPVKSLPQGFPVWLHLGLVAVQPGIHHADPQHDQRWCQPGHDQHAGIWPGDLAIDDRHRYLRPVC